MPTLTPFLWFDGNVDAAVAFYRSVFPDLVVIRESRSGTKLGSVTLRVMGQELILFDGGPHFQFSEAVSLFIQVETQDEVNDLWAKLCAGGKPGRCGWLKDRFGLSWQVVPRALGELMQDPDPARVQRVVQAMMKMTRLDIEGLRLARDAGA
jgi:hypothetical protein